MSLNLCGAPWRSSRLRVFATLVTVPTLLCVGGFELNSHKRTTVQSPSVVTWPLYSHYDLTQAPLGSFSRPVLARIRKPQFTPIRVSGRNAILHTQTPLDVVSPKSRDVKEGALFEIHGLTEMGGLTGEGTNEALVKRLRRAGLIKSGRVFDVMLQVRCMWHDLVLHSDMWQVLV